MYERIKKFSQNGWLAIFFVLFPFFQPRATDFLKWLDIIYKGLTIAVFLYAVYVFLVKKYRIKNKFSLFTIGAATLYEGWYILAAIFNGQPFLSYGVDAVRILVLLFFTCYYVENNPWTFLRVLCILMNAMILINVSSYFWIQEGHLLDATENTVYFWNTNNHLISLYLVAFALNCMMFKRVCIRNKFILGVFNLMILANLVYIKVATALIGIIIFIIMYAISNLKAVRENKKISYIFHPFILCGVGIISHILIVGCRIQNLFSWLIVDTLHKSLTLTGRTNIWDIAIELIKKKPVIGYGYAEIVSYKGFQLMAHNQFLDIIAQAGIIGLVLFFIYCGFVINRLWVYKKYWTAKVIMIVAFAYLIMMIAERVSPFKPFYILFALACYIPEMENIFIQEKQPAV